jgi:hypothetical protein
MKKVVEMPEVQDCEVAGCLYNRDNACHALAITVGDMTGHLCDTMMSLGRHNHRTDTAGIGACRAVSCVHNEDFECQADGIRVSMSGGRAQCVTFSAR